MYRGLTQSVSGFFQPYKVVLDTIAPAPTGTVALACSLLLVALAHVSAETRRFGVARSSDRGTGFSIQDELVQALRW